MAQYYCEGIYKYLLVTCTWYKSTLNWVLQPAFLDNYIFVFQRVGRLYGPASEAYRAHDTPTFRYLFTRAVESSTRVEHPLRAHEIVPIPLPP